MKMSKGVVNTSLAALLQGSGFASLNEFAEAVAAEAWKQHGIRVAYDHISVQRWLAGRTCQHGDIVAAVLSRAWGIPIAASVIWPSRGEGTVPAHQQVWVAERTLESLTILVGSDMLTRREVLTDAISVASGAALVEPIKRWLGESPIGVIGGADRYPGQIGECTVLGIEQATARFAAADASVGGGLSREAAVGQLKYALDLLRHGSYRQAVGDRLLAAVAELAGMVGWMSHDVGMEGPAQRYFLLGLHAARESGNERSGLLAVTLLANLARQARALGKPDTGLRLVQLALEHLPNERSEPVERAMLRNLEGRMYAGMGLSYRHEMRSVLNLAFDIHGDAEPSARTVAYTDRAELSGVAAACYRELAAEDRRFAADAERHVVDALSSRDASYTRSIAFDRIGLARTRFLAGEPEQGCVDGLAAVDMSSDVTASRRFVQRLSELVEDSAPYQDLPVVQEFRAQLATVTSAA